MSTIIRVLAARRLERGAGPDAVAAVELDGVLTLAGVEVVPGGLDGRPVALPPRRPWGDEERVLAWSDRIARRVAVAILDQLSGGRVAVSDFGGPTTAQLYRSIWGEERQLEGVPEALVPSAALPPDPRKRPGRLDPEELAAAIAAEPGIGRTALAEAFDVGTGTIGQAAGRLAEQGRIRAELNGRGYRYFPAEVQP